MKFIHFTDTHLVRPGRSLYGLDLQGQLDACVASINELHGDVLQPARRRLVPLG